MKDRKGRSMREKRIRGMKRKTANMIRRIEENTAVFPEVFTNGYRDFKLPVAQGFIDSGKTSRQIRRLCMQKLLDRASHLMEIRPDDNETYRVVAAIFLPKLWSSQLIVFKGDEYFASFFDRENDYQTWMPLSSNRHVQVEWELFMPSRFQSMGYREIIKEDKACYEGQIWFFGDIQ